MEVYNFIQVMQEVMLTIAVIGVAWLIPEFSKLKEYREIGHELTPEEVDYVKNDVAIMVKALKRRTNNG